MLSGLTNPTEGTIFKLLNRTILKHFFFQAAVKKKTKTCVNLHIPSRKRKYSKKMFKI